MDNYEILETIHKSKTGETIVFKVKEKNKKTCDKVSTLYIIFDGLISRCNTLLLCASSIALKIFKHNSYFSICEN